MSAPQAIAQLSSELERLGYSFVNGLQDYVYQNNKIALTGFDFETVQIPRDTSGRVLVAMNLQLEIRLPESDEDITNVALFAHISALQGTIRATSPVRRFYLASGSLLVDTSGTHILQLIVRAEYVE